jgi:hypothetical protein
MWSERVMHGIADDGEAVTARERRRRAVVNLLGARVWQERSMNRVARCVASLLGAVDP